MTEASAAVDSDQPPGFVLDQTGGNLALDLFVVDQHLGALLDIAFAGTGVTPSQYAVYAQLGRAARTPGQLAETLGVRRATLSGYLSAMQSRGHITRSPHGSDGRSALIALTPEGRAQRRSCRQRMTRAVAALDAQVGSSAGVATLRLALGQLDEAIRTARAILRKRLA